VEIYEKAARFITPLLVREPLMDANLHPDERIFTEPGFFLVADQPLCE
jgi:hypothetical protein